MPLPTLIFATNNQYKADEIRHVLQGRFQIKTLKEAGIDIEIPEPHQTLEGNASEKSAVIHKLTGSNCFSEDTGLEVVALNGAPGVKSARYAGEAASFEDNMRKLLHEMVGREQREAQFRTVISLILDKREYRFEGTCKGKITKEKHGESGFGYDPLFIPDGSEKTFGQMHLNEKTIYSHRKKATEKFIAFLKEQYVQDKN